MRGIDPYIAKVLTVCKSKVIIAPRKFSITITAIIKLVNMGQLLKLYNNHSVLKSNYGKVKRQLEDDCTGNVV